MDEQLAWRNLCGADARLAERAFAFLQNRYLPVLHGYLRHTGVANRDDRDDLISSTFYKLWSYRENVVFANETAGRSYLYTIASRCLIDSVRVHSRTRTVSHETLQGTPEEPAAEDSPEAQVCAKIVMAQLVTAANCLWLGLDSSLLPATHMRQLLAAQQYYLENCSLKEVLRLLQPAPPAGEPKLTLDVLQAWLRHPGVLRLLAYEQLLYEPAKLVSFLLDLPHVSSSSIRNLLSCAASYPPDAPAMAEMPWSAVVLAILRYYHCVSADEVVGAKHAAVQPWGYTREQTLAVLDMLRARLPFCEEVKTLMESLEPLETPTLAEILGRAQLWERLAFQYSYLIDLAQKDILERLEPPAALAGYLLSSNTLNSWISGRRMQASLLRYWRDMYGDPNDV